MSDSKPALRFDHEALSRAQRVVMHLGQSAILMHAEQGQPLVALTDI